MFDIMQQAAANRSTPALTDPSAAAGTAGVGAAGVGAPRRGGAAMSLDRLYWPPRAGGRARFLVVLCHGVGASGRQVRRLAAAWSDMARDVAFVAPHAPLPQRSRYTRWLAAAGLRGREWYSLHDRSAAAEEAGARTAASLLDRFVDAELRRLDLPPEALVLAGFSQGAIIALFAGLRRAAPPRGILSFSGALPAPPSLAHELANRAPVLLVHGEADGIVSVARAREAEQVLRGLDVPVQLLALPGTGHVIDPAGIRAGGAFLRQVLT